MRSTKTATKRRAAARRRTREIGRHLFAYGVIAILVIGTVSTIFVAQAPIANAPTEQPTATTISQGPLDQLVTQADQAAAKGDWTSAIGLYNAYLAQNPGSPDVNFKLGKAYANANPPDYAKASQYLQQAVRLNPNHQEALSLLSEVSSKITPGATTSVPVTGTLASPISGTVTLTGTTVTGTASITTTRTTTSTITLTPQP